jgi:glutathione S-transferase
MLLYTAKVSARLRSSSDCHRAETMPTLHHFPLSAPCRFVRLALAEIGEDVTLVEEMPGDRREEFLLLNPAGTLPVLIDDDGTVVVAAPAIAEYLSETRGGRLGDPKLMPASPAERAEVRRIADWFLGKMEAEVTGYLLTEKVLKRKRPADSGGGAPDAAAIRAARTNIRYHLGYAGYLAARRDCLVGRELTYADLAAAAAFSTVDYLGEVPWEEDPAAKAWYARMKSRPSFRPLLADSLKGLPASSHYANLDF